MTTEQTHFPEQLVTGPGGYDYGDALALPGHLQDNEFFARPYWGHMRELLAGSFVISGGRQDKQLCEMVAGALLLQEEAVPVEYDVLESGLAVEAIRNWGLPGAHTKAPNRTEGQVAGVYHFWWLSQGDAFRWVDDPSDGLPDNEELARRYEEECGVELYVTSSTTEEEMNNIYKAYQSLRDDPEATAHGLDDFVLNHCLLPHIKGALHWGAIKRPRTDRGDVHETRWRTAMDHAASKELEDRTVYDRLLVREGLALRRLLSMDEEELEKLGHTEMRERHDKAVALHNRKHPGAEIRSLVDGIPLEED